MAKKKKSGFSSKKRLAGSTVAAKMRKYPTMASYAKRVYKRKSVSEADLNKMLPDYVSGGDIFEIFKNA